MAQLDLQVPDYKTSKTIQFDWPTFTKGLNTLLRSNEIEDSELSQADNLMLIGKGVPTKRWGISTYNTANATGSVRGLEGFYKSDGTNELLSITDQGYLTKKNGTTFTQINGASWATGNDVQMAQLNNTMYIVNGQRELVKYSSPTLVGFPTIGKPTILSATNISGATGTTIKGYRLSAVSNVGETLASTTFELAAQPRDLGGTAGGVIKLQFTAASAASGIGRAINIYGRDSGNETFIGSTDYFSTTFYDDGSAVPLQFTYPPTADSTGGPVAKYVERFQDRLIFAGLTGEPSKVLISGRVPNHEKFDLSYGGNYIKIEPDAGDAITGLKTFKDRVIVFKERSIWQITFSTEQIGNFFVTTPSLQLITASHGCVSAKSIAFVENDIYFLSRTGVHSLGYQVGYQGDQLRSNEVSAKVRPFFEDLDISKAMKACATYFDFKYIISFPGTDRTMVFDVRRGSWMGPWTFDANVIKVYIDSDSSQHLLIGRDDSPNVDELSSFFGDDKGTTISTTLATKKEDLDDWSLFKTIKDLFLQLKNVTGSVSVDIKLETRAGTVATAKSFNIVPTTGQNGWGADLWGAAQWGSSNAAPGLTGADTADQIIWVPLNKAGRTVQLIVKTTNRNDNYELLGIKGNGKPIGSGFRPSSWRVT